MIRALTRTLGALGLLVALGTVWLDAWIAATVLPPLSAPLSPSVLARDGSLLRAWPVGDGTWRLPVGLRDVDPGYLALLIATEDRRFPTHSGVDPWALVRAAVQAAQAGRVVSGGSTLTMQVARLIEGSGTGALPGKLRQIRVALALERRLSKAEILGLYLHHAPYGGNVEGVRAATLTWFGKEPLRLTAAEAALLVALPQAPEARRPDRHPGAARTARDRVLDRAAAFGLLPADEATAARSEAVPLTRRPFPQLAPHLGDRLRAAEPDSLAHHTTLDAGLQAALEALLRARVRDLSPSLSAALIVADHRTGVILAEIGAPDYADTTRRGFVDMSVAARSPGSLLKPLIYGIGFETGLIHPETVIEDRLTRFGAWEPQNFDRAFLGAITVRRALQTSRNIPAVAVLDAIGPAHLLARLRRGGAVPRLPPGGAPGLAIGLGGLGLTLTELTGLYAAIARGGESIALTDRPGDPRPGPRVLTPAAAWMVGDVLAGVTPPPTAATQRLAYKTGTSYGHRDAWAIGFDGAHVIGVWLGRADATALPGILGADLAAPILFEAFGRLKERPVPLPPPPAEVLTVATAALPAPLRSFRGGDPVQATTGPQIAFPPDGARLDLGLGEGTPGRMVIKVRGGQPPYAFLVDGKPLAAAPYDREVVSGVPGPGFLSIAVVDAAGLSARARVWVE